MNLKDIWEQLGVSARNVPAGEESYVRGVLMAARADRNKSVRHRATIVSRICSLTHQQAMEALA